CILIPYTTLFRSPPRNRFSSSYYRNVVTRFFTVLDTRDWDAVQIHSGGQDVKNLGREPVCILNEQPPPDAGATQNAGTPWIDPGGPGDTVTIVVNFNHPLVTPLGLAPYIPLQARRAAVNEAFRAADATGALQGGPAITADIDLRPTARIKIKPGAGYGEPYQEGGIWILEVGQVPDALVFLSAEDSEDHPPGFITNYRFTQNLPGGIECILAETGVGEPDPVVDEPTLDTRPECYKDQRFRFPVNEVIEVFLTVTDNGGNSASAAIRFRIKPPDPPTPPTDTPAPTATAPPIPPFTCDLLTASDVSFFNNRVYIDTNDANQKSTVMTRAEFHWRKIAAFPNMTVTGMSLNGVLHWRGQDATPPTDTNADVPNPPSV